MGVHLSTEYLRLVWLLFSYVADDKTGCIERLMWCCGIIWFEHQMRMEGVANVLR
jgi:hypothetical protein